MQIVQSATITNRVIYKVSELSGELSANVRTMAGDGWY